MFRIIDLGFEMNRKRSGEEFAPLLRRVVPEEQAVVKEIAGDRMNVPIFNLLLREILIELDERFSVAF